MSETLKVPQIGAWDFDFTTEQFYLDEHSGALLALPADRPVSCEEVLSRIHPEDRVDIGKRLQTALKPQLADGRQIKFKVMLPDGSIRKLLGRGTTFFSRDEQRQSIHMVGTILDLTIVHTPLTALEQSRKRFQDLVETVNDWVWEVNQNGAYTYASPRVKDLIGYKPEEVIGLTPFDFMPDSEKTRVKNEFIRIMTMREPFLTLENTNRHKDGHLVVLETSGVPYYSEEGAFLGYRGIDRDISDRKRAEEQLLSANRELDAFVYTVAHDLRTPLTPIIGYAEVLRRTCRDRLDNKSLDYLAEIESQGLGMLSLMEDLLALAKIGHVPRPAEPIDLNWVVEEALDSMGLLIAETGVVIEKKHLPMMRMPKAFLTQTFYNLIGNSIRYAGSEGHPIEVGGKRIGDLVRIYVQDHGPGIPEEERNRIFEVFFRGSAGKKVSGTGVGLATVLKIAHLYGGQAWVEETLGGGSTFWVEWMDAMNTFDKADPILSRLI